MPSSQSVSRTISGLARSRSRVAIGVGAASAAALASVIGVAAGSGGPAVSFAAYHGAGLTSAAAISPASHVTSAAADRRPAAGARHTSPVRAGSAAAASPQVASAPAKQQAPAADRAFAASPQAAPAQGKQQAPAAGSAFAASPQAAPALMQQQAPAAGTSLVASPQVAAAPSEMQARAASANAPGQYSAALPGAARNEPTATASPSAAATAQPAAAQPAAAPAQPAPAPQPAPQPYWMYDSVTPSAIPSFSQAVAVYANGQYAAQPSQVGQRGLVMWIDTNGSDPRADVLDVEPGDATPSQAATWVAAKLDASPNSVAIVYTMRSEWGAVQCAINALPWWMPSHTRYWIADPTGVPHIVPGSQATQWYWGQNYDISTALPNF
jgi:hypothetical protein